MRDVLRRQWRELRLNLRPREFAYWLVQNFLLLVFRFTMRAQMFGGEHYAPPASATLLLCGHKRDWDPLLCATHLYYQRGWWRPDGRRMAFVGREDMFTRGFLAEIVGYREWPRWTRWLLDHITLTPIIAPLRAYPIVRLLEFSTRQYLFELRQEQGNLPLTEVFSDEFLAQLDRWAGVLARRSHSSRPRLSRELHIRDILTWRYRELLMERLRRRSLLPAQYEAYKTRQRQKITRQLQAAVGALASGDTLWLAPEGMITQDGAPRRVRESLHEMLAMIPSDTCILPVNVTYDFMTTDRMRACISVGPPLEGLANLDRRDLGKAVIAAITGQTVVTMSMLGSRFLWECLQQEQPVFTFEAAWATLARNVQLFAKQGATLEQGLRDARLAQRRLESFLAYGLRHGLLSRQPDCASSGGRTCGGGRLRELGSRILAPVGRSDLSLDRAYRVNPAPFQQQRESFFWLNPRYPVNELAALEEALAQRARSIIAHP